MSDPKDSIIEELLQAKFDAAEHRTYDGKGGKPMTYIEDETVMDRLDLVLGFGGWQVTEATPISDTCVRLTLATRHPKTGEWTSYTDFGYVTNREDSREPSKEPLKEAWTDAFRRVARIPGVARYVYAGEAPGITTQGQAQTPPAHHPAAPAIPQQPVAAAPQPLHEGQESDFLFDEGSCPEHGPWVLKPAGTSKSTGKPYAAFWACPHQGRPFCDNKPSREWAARQSAA